MAGMWAEGSPVSMAMLAIALGSFPGPALSQTLQMPGLGTPDLVHLSGSISTYGEAYSMAGQPSRRPPGTGRLYFQPTLRIWQIDLPFEFILSTEGRSFQQPFDQFGVSPHIGWMTLHAGYHHLSLSEFTANNMLTLGGGVDLRPGIFRFTFSAGRTQQAVSADTAQRLLQGTYRRYVYAMKIGVGSEGGSLLDLNVLRGRDDAGSLLNPGFARPQENLVVGLNDRLVVINNALAFASEVALSAFTPDMNAEPLSVHLPTFVTGLFTPRVGSSVGYAGKGAVTFRQGGFSLLAQYQRVNPGFVSFGLPSFQNDQENVIVSPSLRTLQGRMMLGATVGFRRDNLLGNKLATTRRLEQSYSAMLMPAPALTLDLRYSNFLMRNDSPSDTNRFDNTSQAWTLGPTLRGQWLGVTHVVGIQLGYQQFDDRNTVFGAANNSRTSQFSASWALMFPSTLIVTPRFSYLNNERVTFNTSFTSAGLSIQYSFFDRKLTPVLSGLYSSNRLGAARDRQFTGMAIASYRLTAFDTITMTARLATYHYGNARAGDFTESVASIQYNRSF